MGQVNKAKAIIDSKRTTILDVALLAVCLLFYLLFPLCDGPIWCVDSASYVTMDISREPLYPVFLAFAGGLAKPFGADSLMVTVILQSLLAGFAAWFAGLTIKRTKNQSIVLQLATIGFQFAVSLLCRFAAIRGSVYTDCIMTEGIGFSLFVLFTLELYLSVNTDRKRHFLWTFFLSFLLICLRKQMLITLLIMGIVFGWYYIVGRPMITKEALGARLRKFLCLLGMLAAVLTAAKLTDRIYNYIVRDAWIEHCHNSMGFLCTLLYCSDSEKDQDLFTDATMKELYLEIMSQADEQQILYPYAESGWLPVCEHFADSYDAIGYGIINPVVEGYIAGHFNLTQVEAALQYDEICGAMSRTLLRQSMMPMLQVCAYNIWRGFVNSIARAKPLLSFYALAAYACMGATAWYLAIQKKKTGGEHEQIKRQIEYSLSFTFIVIVSIAINSLVVGLTIFTQPRYMIYSMGFFYTAGCMLLYDSWHCYRLMRGSMPQKGTSGSGG